MSASSRATVRGSPLGSTDHAESTARAVRQMFSAVAHRYDFLNHFLSLGRDIAWRKATAQALGELLARPGSLALDVCCGTGDLALALANISDGKVIATDFCHPMLQRAQAKSQHAPRVFLLEGDALTLPFCDNLLDAVTIAFGLRNLADYERGLLEIRRVLKRGGLVAILEFSQLRWPLFGPLFRFYFHHILPRVGTWVSGVSGPYQYLPDSVSKFPDQDSLATLLRKVGFNNVRYLNFTGGVAALHLGEKA